MWTVYAVKPGNHGFPVVFRQGGYCLGGLNDDPARLDDKAMANAMKAIGLLEGRNVCWFNVSPIE